MERAQAGDLHEVVKADNHPSQPLANEPFCTRSQIVAYFDRHGAEVARAHRYLRTDNTLGASGKPDPKRIREGNVLYIVEPDLDRRRR